MLNATDWLSKKELRIHVLGTLTRDVSLSGGDESLSAMSSRESGRKKKRDGEYSELFLRHFLIKMNGEIRQQSEKSIGMREVLSCFVVFYKDGRNNSVLMEMVQ